MYERTIYMYSIAYEGATSTKKCQNWEGKHALNKKVYAYKKG